MTDRSSASFAGIDLVRRSWARLHGYWRTVAARVMARQPDTRDDDPHHGHLRDLLHRPRLPGRRLVIGSLLTCALVGIGVGGLWLRLSSGPLTVDMITPWLTA